MLQRFEAVGTWPATGNLLLVPSPSAPHIGRAWHVITLRASRTDVITGAVAGDAAWFFVGVGDPPAAGTGFNFHGNPADLVDDTHGLVLPCEAWYPVGDERVPGGLVVPQGKQLYAIVYNGQANQHYAFTGYAEELDP